MKFFSTLPFYYIAKAYVTLIKGEDIVSSQRSPSMNIGVIATPIRAYYFSRRGAKNFPVLKEAEGKPSTLIVMTETIRTDGSIKFDAVIGKNDLLERFKNAGHEIMVFNDPDDVQRLVNFIEVAWALEARAGQNPRSPLPMPGIHEYNVAMQVLELHSFGALTDAQVGTLEQLPGWSWEPSTFTRQGNKYCEALDELEQKNKDELSAAHKRAINTLLRKHGKGTLDKYYADRLKMCGLI